MPRVRLPIAEGFYIDESKPISAQECTNWIPRIQKTKALAQPNAIGTPGISQFATAANDKAGRGSFVQKKISYSVNGNRFYRINSDGTVTDLGTIDGTGRVSMASNGTQICIVVPLLKGYIFTVAGGLVDITDTVFTTTLGPSEQVVEKDGFFIHFKDQKYFISALNDGLTYSALDFETAAADPDEITGIHVNHNILYVGGANSIEPVQIVGGADFPYKRIEGALIQKGVAAKFSLINFANTFVFVGSGSSEQPAIWQFSAGNVIKISTGAIDKVLRSKTQAQIEAIFATTYASRDGFFVNFHLNDRTFTYDSTTSVWHERKSKNTSGQLINWRANDIIDAYGINIVTDNTSGKIGRLDDDLYSEYGTSINRVVSGAFLHNQNQRLTVGQMELTCESGVGNIVAPSDDPQVTRSFSDDGGFTFSNGTSRSLGKQGEYNKRQIWRREGQVNRTRVYRFVVDETVKAVIIKLEADVA